MDFLDSWEGIAPYDVLVESVGQAKDLRGLDFSDKLDAVKDLSVGAMRNAYELWQQGGEGAEEFRNIVMNLHPLSEALDKEAGCCRYQGALFFVLGYEADLGNHHFLQSARIGHQVSTVFNEVYNGRERHIVSIFRDSLTDICFDYSRGDDGIFDRAKLSMPGRTFYSYHGLATGSKILTVENSRPSSIVVVNGINKQLGK